MIWRILIITALALLASAANAQLLDGVSRASSGGGAGTIVVCSGSALDFTQACNSVYITVVQ